MKITNKSKSDLTLPAGGIQILAGATVEVSDEVLEICAGNPVFLHWAKTGDLAPEVDEGEDTIDGAGADTIDDTGNDTIDGVGDDTIDGAGDGIIADQTEAATAPAAAETDAPVQSESAAKGTGSAKAAGKA